MTDRVRRREALAAGALGITVTVLPAAARAASPVTAVPSGEPPSGGGVVTKYTLEGVAYFVHTFVHDPADVDGEGRTAATFTLSEARDVDVLVVGGGGGGGGTRGRGGNCGGGGGEVVVTSGVSVTAGLTTTSIRWVGPAGPGS